MDDIGYHLKHFGCHLAAGCPFSKAGKDGHFIFSPGFRFSPLSGVSGGCRGLRVAVVSVLLRVACGVVVRLLRRTSLVLFGLSRPPWVLEPGLACCYAVDGGAVFRHVLP